MMIKVILIAFFSDALHVEAFNINFSRTLFGTRQTSKLATKSFLEVSKSRPLSWLRSKEEDTDQDEEIFRLKSMAAKLRAEAAALEVERAETLAVAAQKAFDKFDLNKDGQISVSELKQGLEKEFKTELSDARVEALMKTFDASGDGALQLNEFVTIDVFRNKLSELAREEKELVAQAKKEALKEAEKSKITDALIEQINDKPPTPTDRVLSTLPYLFPLLDGLQYGRFLINDDSGSNPLVVALALLYTLYRSIPFSGFIAFFALNILSGNFSINRLIRFNMQQAIFLDIALFFPALLLGLGSLVGAKLPSQVGEIFNDVIFVSLLVTISYCVISSLLGKTPDKIPAISENVNKRMPSIDKIDVTFIDAEDIEKLKKDIERKESEKDNRNKK